MSLLGRVDGVREGEIYGWALDTQNPCEAVEIAIHVNHARAGEVLAHYYRPDVAERMNSSGRQGFYIDLTGYCDGLREVIADLRFPDGHVVPGTPLCLRVSRRSRGRGC